MGQCTSRKAAGAFAVSTTSSQRSIVMQRHQNLEKSPNEEREKKQQQSLSKGVAMSFGFKKRSVIPTLTGNPAAARRLAIADVIDRNGNRNSDSLSVSSGRTTPRLAPPKKEANATRVSRFGFRQPSANRYNKISDMNTIQPTQLEYRNNNAETARIKPIPTKITSPVDSNKNATGKIDYGIPTKFTLQTTKLPTAEFPVRIIESKTAKTLANNNKKISNAGLPLDDSSSKDGSLTEDSGVDSHVSTGNADPDNGIETLSCSPTFGARRNRQKSRTLGVVVTGNTFDVRDLDDCNEPVLPLPCLPSAFQNTGLVRERTLEYQRNIDRNRRKSGDYGEEEKTYSEKYTNEKSLPPVKTFLKSKQFKSDLSPPSSDDQLWGNAGEAMADDFNCSFSSSDESKDKDQSPIRKPADVTAAFETLMNASLTNSMPKNEIRHVLLTIEDPKFAAVAAASKTSNLLEDETSPTDSLVCSYSEAAEEGKRKLSKSSSNSKDINEKQTLTISCPGTPTNASNSLSLSEGKDFLIDDEIADQPALVFDETLTSVNSESFAPPVSENNTLIESTPKQRRKAFESSPLLNRRRKTLLNRSDSVETLSACESIASDDMMLEYDYSQSSGLDEVNDRSERRQFYSLDDSVNRTIAEFPSRNELVKEWSNLAGNFPKTANRTRLLKSRATTPSSIPDSPRSVDSRSNIKSRSSLSHSPLRLTRTPLTSHVGYDSDDSVRLDRASHNAVVQEVMSMKAMLLKLKRVLHESETHNPFDTQRNGLFNGLSSETDSVDTDESSNSRLELEDLRRQVLFLQGQVEDREKTVHQLQLEMTKLINCTSNSAPASTTFVETCNAATQTDRVRPISAGPSLLQTSPTEGNMGSLVSANETSRRSRLPLNEKAPPRSPSISKPLNNKRRPPPPGETPSPQKPMGATSSPSPTSSSSIPRRSLSRPRASPTAL